LAFDDLMTWKNKRSHQVPHSWPLLTGGKGFYAKLHFITSFQFAVNAGTIIYLIMHWKLHFFKSSSPPEGTSRHLMGYGQTLASGVLPSLLRVRKNGFTRSEAIRYLKTIDRSDTLAVLSHHVFWMSSDKDLVPLLQHSSLSQGLHHMCYKARGREILYASLRLEYKLTQHLFTSDTWHFGCILRGLRKCCWM